MSWQHPSNPARYLGGGQSQGLGPPLPAWVKRTGGAVSEAKEGEMLVLLPASLW